MPQGGVYLIADTRERAVVPFLETEVLAHAFAVRQINTGDYLICRARRGAPPEILAAIERKTHADFAASFKDGRHENLGKMLALRAATGCRLYYFLEGAAFPPPGRRYARIPFGNILAAATKMMVRDGVFIVQTADESHTARRLADFLRAYDGVSAAVDGGCAPAADAVDAAEAAAAAAVAPDAPALDAAAGGCDLSVPDALLSRIPQTDQEAAAGLWMRLRGISVVLARILTREVSVAGLATQSITPDAIRALKTATGRRINPDAVQSLLGIREGSAAHAARLLSGVRNISEQAAATILDSVGGLAALCAGTVAQLSAVRLPQKGRTVQLGRARAERILRILHYKEPPRAAPISDADVGEFLAALGGQ
jgi:ERCC4-type nuclease